MSVKDVIKKVFTKALEAGQECLQEVFWSFW